MANKNARCGKLKRMIRRKEKTVSVLVGIFLLVMTATIIGAVTWIIVSTNTVFVEWPSENVVRIENGRGQMVPEAQWDRVLAGQYDRQYVGEDFRIGK